jgi:hypothetical protein
LSEGLSAKQVDTPSSIKRALLCSAASLAGRWRQTTIAEVAIAHVNWELLGDARTQKPRRGVFIFVLTRQNVGWLVAAAQNTEIERTVK